MSNRRVLVIGSGGREHALAWRLSRDPVETEVLVAPGNPGIAGSFPCVGVSELDADGLVSLARQRAVDLVVVGPEAPLAAGVADALHASGVPVFGASRAGARLEASKWFAKQIMREASVPTASGECVSDLADVRAALDRHGPPYVVKADGLAAGKGVLVTRLRAEAETFAADCLDARRFGEAGRKVVIEEFLPGEEASAIAICDGERHLLLPIARDYKRALDGDRGANTGGMGAVAPAPHVDQALERTIGESVVTPVLRRLAAHGTPYRGALYCGLMVNGREVSVVEFNCRFGDPETQAVMPLLEGDLGGLLASAAGGALEPGRVRRRAGAAVAVALVGASYPERSEGGGWLPGLDEAVGRESAWIFHAATARENGTWRVAGGRAAYVVAMATDREAARRTAYDVIARIGGTGWRCRRDIGMDPSQMVAETLVPSSGPEVGA